jgi:endonuclease/exonuclease/phosphatase family metal-dependent hydrolase
LSVKLKVLTINVENTFGDRRRQQVLNTEIRRLDPDLVAFQEVIDRPGLRQVDTLVAGTRLHTSHQNDVMAYRPPAVDYNGGSAIATRWPHHIVEVADLRVGRVRSSILDADIVPWCTLASIVNVPDLGELLFINTTAAWPLAAERVRERQAVAITDLDARHRRALPTIVAGDFNATPDSASVRYLTGKQSLEGESVFYYDAWEIAGDGPGYTWSDKNSRAQAMMNDIVRQPRHNRRIDYVFIGGVDAHPDAHAYVHAAKLVLDRQVEGLWPSDHFGVMVELEIGTGVDHPSDVLRAKLERNRTRG